MEKETKKGALRPAKGAGRGAAVWSLCLGALSTLLLVVLAALLMVYSTLCSASYMQNIARDSGFAATMYITLKEDYMSYGAATGFSPETMTGFLDEDQIAKDLDESIERLYQATYTANPHDEIAQSLYQAMEQEAAARGLELSSENAEGIEQLVQLVRVEYANYTAVPLATQLHTIISKVLRVIWVGVAVCAVLAAVALFLTVAIPRRQAPLGVRCLVYSLLGAALVCLLLGVAVYPMLPLPHLNLEPLAYKNLIVSYVQGMFARFNLFAAIYFVLALLVAELLGLRKKGKKPRYLMDAENMPLDMD